MPPSSAPGGLDAVVFDKTGTLTEGRFGVSDVVPLGALAPIGRVLGFAAALESQSEHPIAARHRARGTGPRSRHESR